ncbi:hypothetical protein F0919_15430 [Taibaiella lutea]|uniref:Uncharacterized protein n=1 Tax=Taibaiella lutea TaxID=2608001 RepID=A0A5M6CB19_9BACT|nr:hypothetical protein [Taibaiella lutea]KAA5532191.1 hypothetical protein F0919_15430 [Taibaiella lutea]
MNHTKQLALTIGLLSSFFAAKSQDNTGSEDPLHSVCECSYVNKKKTTFSNDLKALLSYNDFKTSGFDFKNGEQGFEDLFIKDLDPSNLTIWTSKPINLVYKNKFGLNLTPCKSSQNYYEIYAMSKVFGDDREDAFDVTIQLLSIGINISEKVIRRWDTASKKPLLNKGASVSSPILISSAGRKELSLFLTGEKGFSRFENTQACMNETEITNTNVGIKLNGMFLFDLSYSTEYVKYYLGAGIGSYFRKLGITNVDTNTFTGIYSGSGSITFPLKDMDIKSDEGNTFILNNDLIAGKVKVKCFRTENNNEVLIPVNNKENKRYDINKLSAMIQKLGFDKVKTEIQDNNLFIYFIKFAGKK